MLRGPGETELFDSFLAPEARWTLAGGEASAEPPEQRRPPPRAPAGAQDQTSFLGAVLSGVPSGRGRHGSRSRWFRQASPPANIRRASGTKSLSIGLINQVPRNISQ